LLDAVDGAQQVRDVVDLSRRMGVVCDVDGVIEDAMHRRVVAAV
jgi:predicted signal transduction protein with EAL and GGDEF domain